jgi:hypothetical protein
VQPVEIAELGTNGTTVPVPGLPAVKPVVYHSTGGIAVAVAVVEGPFGVGTVPSPRPVPRPCGWGAFIP